VIVCNEQKTPKYSKGHEPSVSSVLYLATSIFTPSSYLKVQDLVESVRNQETTSWEFFFIIGVTMPQVIAPNSIYQRDTLICVLWKTICHASQEPSILYNCAIIRNYSLRAAYPRGEKSLRFGIRICGDGRF